MDETGQPTFSGVTKTVKGLAAAKKTLAKGGFQLGKRPATDLSLTTTVPNKNPKLMHCTVRDSSGRYEGFTSAGVQGRGLGIRGRGNNNNNNYSYGGSHGHGSHVNRGGGGGQGGLNRGGYRGGKVEDHLASAEENSDYEDAAPSVSPDTSRSKAKSTKKRKPSSVASEENKNSEEGAPFVSANSSHSAATKPQKRKTPSDPSKKSSVSKAKASKKLCQSSDTKSSTPFRKPAKSSSRTQKSLSDKSSASSPSIPNVDIPLPPSLQSAFPTVADPSQFSFTPTDPNSPSSVSSVQEFVTFTVPSDSSVGSGSNYALTQLGSCTNPVGQSTSPFSFSNNGSRTLSYYEM